jgi:flagellar hook-associated protein 2
MSTAPLVFTGVSTFSNDFQTILTRASSIANLPVTALTNQQTDIQSEKVLAGNLRSAIADLGTSLGNLAALGATNGTTATSTNSSVVTATTSGAPPAATYSISNVTSIARAASETSLTGYPGWQTSAVYTALTGDATNPDTQSLTFTLNDSSGISQTTTVNLTGGAAGLDGAGAVSAINTALQATGNATLMGITATAGSGGAISFSSNSSASFTVGFGAVAGVDNTGGFAAVQDSTLTAAGAPVSATGTLQLTLGGVTTPIVLAADKNNLAGLRDAINALNLGVTASVLNTGTGSLPNYLALSANQTGATTLTLTDGATNLLTSTNQGANTVFDLNGLHVIKSSAVVGDVVPGVTFTFNGTTTAGQTVGVSLASDGTKISTALQDLVAKYNTVSGQINAQIGPAGGLLSGNPIIVQARQALFSLMNSSASGGSVMSLASLGIELSNSGVMSFNSATFNALTKSQIADAYSFLGEKTAGPTAMQSQFTQLSDPATGAIKAQQDAWDAADKRIATQVTDLNARISAMQAALQTKLQMADTLLAGLASQQSILTSSISSLNFTSGYTAKANA